MSEVDDKEQPSTTENGGEPSEAQSLPTLPTVSDFSGFALSLAANAMMNLTDETHDGRITSSNSIDIKAAAEYIDILVMLQQKTSGNLNEEEKKLLESLLYDLRMQYLEVAGQ
jgi:hypothetical protein